MLVSKLIIKHYCRKKINKILQKILKLNNNYVEKIEFYIMVIIILNFLKILNLSKHKFEKNILELNPEMYSEGFFFILRISNLLFKKLFFLHLLYLLYYFFLIKIYGKILRDV